MKDWGLRTIQAVGMILLLTVAAGCFTGQHHDGWNDNNAAQHEDRGRPTAWSSGPNDNQNHDHGWQADRNQEGDPQGYSSNTH